MPSQPGHRAARSENDNSARAARPPVARPAAPDRSAHRPAEQRIAHSFDTSTRLALTGIHRSVSRIAWVSLASFVLSVVLIVGMIIMMLLSTIQFQNEMGKLEGAMNRASENAAKNFQNAMEQIEKSQK